MVDTRVASEMSQSVRRSLNILVGLRLERLVYTRVASEMIQDEQGRVYLGQGTSVLARNQRPRTQPASSHATGALARKCKVWFVFQGKQTARCL